MYDLNSFSGEFLPIILEFLNLEILSWWKIIKKIYLQGVHTISENEPNIRDERNNVSKYIDLYKIQYINLADLLSNSNASSLVA